MSVFPEKKKAEEEKKNAFLERVSTLFFSSSFGPFIIKNKEREKKKKERYDALLL